MGFTFPDSSKDTSYGYRLKVSSASPFASECMCLIIHQFCLTSTASTFVSSYHLSPLFKLCSRVVSNKKLESTLYMAVRSCSLVSCAMAWTSRRHMYLSNFSRNVAKGIFWPHTVISFEIVFPSFVLYLVMVYGEQGSPRMSSPESIKSSQDFLTACGVRLVGSHWDLASGKPFLLTSLFPDRGALI